MRRHPRWVTDSEVAYRTYGGFGDFRRSWLFILVGHVIFTLPFMVRSVLAVFGATISRHWTMARLSRGALPWRRFRDIIVPNARPGILAGSLMVVTLSLGEFNLTWMLHTAFDQDIAGRVGRQLRFDAA
jgi:putative spermidine/putrescine transport system permease protein